MTSKTFIKITNRDIYNKLETIELRLGKINTKANVNSAVIAVIIIIIVAIINSVF